MARRTGAEYEVESRHDGFLPGDVFGEYRLSRYLSRGGCAHVWAAYKLVDDSPVALKVQRGDRLGHAFEQRFRFEANILRGSVHPNLPRYHGFGAAHGRCYIALDLLEGSTCEALIRRRVRLAWRHAVQVTLDVLSALSSMHAGGVIHRDVKPSNVMMCPDGSVRLFDLSLAKPRMFAPSITQHGAVVGSRLSMSPEQARGERVDERCDVYGAGVLLYSLLTLTYPDESPIPPSKVHRDSPPVLDAVVLRAMAPRSTDRYRAASEFAGAISEAVGSDIESTGVREISALRNALAAGAVEIVRMVLGKG